MIAARSALYYYTCRIWAGLAAVPTTVIIEVLR